MNKKNKTEEKTKENVVLANILGIIAVILSFFYWGWGLSIAFGIASIVRKEKLKLGIIAIVLSLVFMIITVIYAGMAMESYSQLPAVS